MTNITKEIKVADLDSASLKDVQTALKALGYYKDKIDGIYGKNTGYGFAEWKTDNWLNNTEVIGPASWAQLSEQAGQISSINWHDNSCKISKHFTVKEVTKGDNARIPTDKTIESNILTLAKQLDTIRDIWGSPIGVTSWYRPPKVNAAVGGASNSQHLYGKAADIYPIGKDINQFQKWLDTYWDKALGYGARRGFVHLDLRPGRIRWHY